ncbi:MAG: hypothetical protein AYK19_07820 [Theionarchaea archaeon DG-70-1]|nr:MAG: hypothetical protein AYK19_07820 [Theionarchaea archaeon DG-70-1]
MTSEEDFFIFEIGEKQLNSVLNKIYMEYRDGNLKIEVDSFSSGIRIKSDTVNEFLADFKLEEDDFNKLIRDIVFFITALVMNDEDKIFRKYTKSDKTEKILNVFNQWSQKFPDMINNLRFRSFCKTQYLENLTWEISTKIKQDSGISMELPVSVLKMSFLKPSTSMACPLSEEKTVTFECTLQDMRDMIKSLREAERIMEELEEKKEVR